QAASGRRGDVGAVAVVVAASLSAIQHNSLATSDAHCHRSSGSFARHFMIRRCRAGGVIGCSCPIGVGCSDMILVIRLAWLLALKARWPVVISYSRVTRAEPSGR